MHRLIICTPFFVPHIGGMERALYRIGIALARRSWTVLIYTSELTPHNPTTMELTLTRTGSSLVRWAEKVRKCSFDFDPESSTILFASFGPGTSYQQLAAGTQFRARGGYTVWRTPTADHARRNLIGCRDKAAIALDRIVANSRVSATMTGSAISGVPISVIPNLLLRDELTTHDEQLKSARSADLAWAGRVEPRKRPEQLMSLLNKAAAKGMTVVAQPVPSFGKNAMFNDFCDLLDRRIRIIEPSNGVHPDIAAARVFLHLTAREGSPNALLEAASRGQMIIASDIPECRELLTDYHGVSWLTNPSDFLCHLEAHLMKPDTIDYRTALTQLIRQRHSESAIGHLWSATLTKPGQRT